LSDAFASRKEIAMTSMFDDYTVETTKDVEAATASVRERAEEKGFSVLGIHDLQVLFGRKGFQHQEVRIVEMCNEEFGSQLLSVDPQMSLMMPCKVVVYAKQGKTYISALRPRFMADFLPSLAPLAEQGDVILCSIVDEAR
jgi:uncharacterized protein (DUF302 family)